MGKDWKQSQTVWVNLLVTLGALAFLGAHFAGFFSIPEWIVGVLVGFLFPAGYNLWRRYQTTEPIVRKEP